MDVITNARAIRSGVIVTEYFQTLLGELADGHLGEEGNEVTRLTARVFSDLSGFVSSGRVEVPQRDRAPCTVGIAEVFQDLLCHDLGTAVARFGLERRSFGNGNDGWGTVDRRRGRVDEVVYLVLLHDLRDRGLGQHGSPARERTGEWTHGEKVDRGGDVVLVVLEGLLAGFADSLVSGDVDDTPDSALVLVGLEDVLDVLLQCQISLDDIDIASLLLFLGSVCGKGLDSEFRDALESRGERIVEAGAREVRSVVSDLARRPRRHATRNSLVDGHDRVVTAEQEAEGNMRS